jgi:hypothetical protein
LRAGSFDAGISLNEGLIAYVDDKRQIAGESEQVVYR